MLLRAAFDLDLLVDRARHEIQYGHAERTTHRNTPGDSAQFEVCNHKWTDLSEGNYGVALLNDCKYGVSTKDGRLQLSLVKCGTHPDERGDSGAHRFTYVLLPHEGGFSVEKVVRPAYELNAPPRVVRHQGIPIPSGSFLRLDSPDVIIETVKQSEDGPGFVVRLYEASRSRTRAVLTLPPGVKSVAQTNMLEESPEPLPLDGGKVQLSFRPFEIKTLLVR